MTATGATGRPGGMTAIGLVADNWWAVGIRGVVAILFGILAILWPGITLLVLVLLFGAFAIVDGVFEVASGLKKDASHDRNWWLIVAGIAGIIAGVVAFVWPGITALVLLYVIAAWAIVRGVAEIIAAYRMRREITNEWWLVLNGILSVIFGILVAVAPGAGALALILVIAAFAIVSGIFLLVLAFQLRSRAGERRPGAGAATTS